MPEDFDDYDVDEAVNRILLPWKLRLTIRGKKFETLCPTIGQIGALSLLAGNKDKTSIQQTIDIISKLFKDPQGALAEMTTPAFIIASKRIMSYANEYALKNSQAVASTSGIAAANSSSIAGDSSPHSLSRVQESATP